MHHQLQRWFLYKWCSGLSSPCKHGFVASMLCYLCRAPAKVTISFSQVWMYNHGHALAVWTSTDRAHDLGIYPAMIRDSNVLSKMGSLWDDSGWLMWQAIDFRLNRNFSLSLWRKTVLNRKLKSMYRTCSFVFFFVLMIKFCVQGGEYCILWVTNVELYRSSNAERLTVVRD